MTAYWLAIGGAILLLLVPAATVLWWQHRGWQRTERDLGQSDQRQRALTAALDAAPDGHFAWFHPSEPTPEDPISAQTTATAGGRCSRRLAVLLDLYRGLDASFEDVLNGFDRESAAELANAASKLRLAGDGFTLQLNHAGTGRNIEVRGVRAVDDTGTALVDLVWMSDVTEGVAEIDTLTRENKALSEERARLRTALDGIRAPVWLRDDDLSLVYCNQAYVSAVGAADAGDAVARSRELAPRASIREARALAAAARASGVTRQSAFHMIIDGSRRLMEVTESPLTELNAGSGEGIGEGAPTLFGDGSGRLTAGIAYDITRQEELETRIKRETGAHADVLERLGTAIAVFGADTRLAFHNTAFVRLWDLEETWLSEGPTYGDLLEILRDARRLPEVADFPAFKEQELDRFHSLIEPREDVMHLPDGVTLRRVIAPHPMGGLLTTYEDVTDTLAMERSYNTMIAVQRETIDNLQEAVAVFAADGRLQLANSSYLALWSLPAQAVDDRRSATEVAGSLRTFFSDETDWNDHRNEMLGALSLESERAARRVRFERKDGKVLDMIAVPLPDGGVLFSYNDVSDPARRELALRTHAKDLSTSERLRSAFIADAMAELRAPLTDLIDGEDQSTAERLAQMLRLVDDIRDLAALEVDRTTLSLDSFDVSAVIDSVAALTRETFRVHDGELAIESNGDLGWIVGDANRVRQLLYHLVVGALKDGPADHLVRLTAARTGQTNGKDSISFTVTGADGSEWPGLTLVRRLADLHGGDVTVTGGAKEPRQVICRLPAGG